MKQIDLKVKRIGSVEDVDSTFESVDLSECMDSCLSLKDLKNDFDKNANYRTRDTNTES